MPELAADINGFISQHYARRGPQPSQHAFTPTPDYYAASLVFSDEVTNGLPTPTQSVSMSDASSETCMSSCFDMPTAQTSSTYIESPPASIPYQHVSVPSSPLVCEFARYTGCNAAFDPSDEAGWIEHNVNSHLGSAFPAVCVCWFCDRKFKASSKSRAGPEACYRERMHHIAKHFRRGVTGRQMRPDFFFLDHIYDYGLIDKKTFQKETMQHEAPQLSGLHPAGWRPEGRPMQDQIESSRSRYRGSSTRHRSSQRYHR
ncbi:hypothetical protein NW752_007878 [Fusarium irregulare]|uniref:Uncharacterized protein n=1 Tax=Fusarium irregulare TaxID=2494466 RepID=A0A9W8PDB1_9HYPO|nr:hypothetical protein NW766_012617 [Fusarium irregulare]KAJ4013577.1 hypothetical protein NW752_007878 [Fusarium irregulare]